jgi:signal transduction histidine kinase
MSLWMRMWLLGALLPSLVMAVVLFGADELFHVALERSLDQALLAQAAVESASLFDGPRNEPHLHMASSPLVESVRPFAPEGVLFGPDGAEIVRFPPRTRADRERITVARGSPGPVFSTQDRPRGRERRLTVTISASEGRIYTLRLSAAMAQLDAAASTFHHLALLAVLACAAVLVAVQTFQARALRRRLSRLETHVEALRAGDLDRTLSPETQSDEVASLGRVLAQATASLRAVRSARERLVADAAHELRTPLTLMRTSLDLALRRERSRDELLLALRETRDEVDRLALLASRLLDVASIAHDDPPDEPCDLAKVVSEAVECARGEAEARSITLHLQAMASLAVKGRPDALRRAVDNLISNALKYARHEVVISLEANGEATLSVRDDGPGIADAEREAVFEPFHRAPGGLPGAGLGLTIVREVARAHGGRAFVRRPAEGVVGADVALVLPAAEPLRS